MLIGRYFLVEKKKSIINNNNLPVTPVFTFFRTMDGFFYVVVTHFSAVGQELSVRARPSDDVLLKKYGKYLDAFLTRLKGLEVTVSRDTDEAARVEIILVCALYCQHMDILRVSMFREEEDATCYDPLVSKTIDECVKKIFGMTNADALARLRPLITEQYRGPVLSTLGKHLNGLPNNTAARKPSEKTSPKILLSDEEWRKASPLQKLVALGG